MTIKRKSKMPKKRYQEKKKSIIKLITEEEFLFC